MQNNKLRLLLFIITGGISAIGLFIAMIFMHQIAASSPLCPDGVVPDLPPSCSFVGVLLPQLVMMLIIALLIFLIFRNYFKHSLLISFFGLYYTRHLNEAIGWLYSPLKIVNDAWIQYVLLFLLGSLVFFVLYFYFVKLKLWLWLKLALAIVVLLTLPFIVLNIERQLYAIFYI